MTPLSPRMLASAALAGLMILGGCTAYDDGYGYGYGGVSLGYSSGYYDPWYSGYYGWYDGFYYPGSGYFIYDRHGRRHRWSDHHRRYWEGRRDRGEWRDHDRDHDGRRDWREDRRVNRDFWRERRRDRHDGAHSGDWGGRREGFASPRRARPDSQAAHPAPRPERGTLGPALKGRGDGSPARQGRKWERQD